MMTGYDVSVAEVSTTWFEFGVQPRATIRIRISGSVTCRRLNFIFLKIDCLWLPWVAYHSSISPQESNYLLKILQPRHPMSIVKPRAILLASTPKWRALRYPRK